MCFQLHYLTFSHKVKSQELARFTIGGGQDMQVIIFDTFEGSGGVKNTLGGSKLPLPAR